MIEPRRRPDRPPDVAPQVNAIVDAAMRCFDLWGVERTRMGDIASQAHVARPTLYRYFPNKEALVLEVMIRHIRSENERIRRQLTFEGSGKELLRQCLVLQMTNQQPKELPGSLLRTESPHQLAHRAANSPEVLEAMKELYCDVLAHAEARGELRHGLDVDAAVRWMVALVLMSLVLPELLPIGDDLARSIDDFVVRALMSDD